ncbi:MAG: ABC transporter transmembrane domain-containing protein, partial [Steroidobacteraceae bacterium]
MTSTLLTRIPAAPYVIDLVLRRPVLAARFAVASIARGALTALVIYLMQQFLAGVLGGTTGLSGRIAGTWGADVALYAVAGALAVCYLLSSAVSYEGQVVEARLIRDIELGLMERVTRHLLTLSVDFFDKTSHGDLILTLRQDVARVRAVVAAQARMVFELAQAIGLIVAAVWLSPLLAFAALIVLPLASAPML